MKRKAEDFLEPTKDTPNMFTAAKNGQAHHIQTMINDGEDINSVSRSPLSKGKTPLEIACQYLQMDVIETLLENGATFRAGHNIDIITDMLMSYHTPLKQLLKMKIFKIMIENGVNIEEFMPVITRHFRVSPTPTSYTELMSLLRNTEPERFNIFPDTTNEEFVSSVDVNISNEGIFGQTLLPIALGEVFNALQGDAVS